MSISSEVVSLHRLARLYNIQTAYYDIEHRRQQPPLEAILAVLKSMGASLSTSADIQSAIRQRRQELWQRELEPVVVDWEGQPKLLKVRLPAHLANVPIAGHLLLETGEQQDLNWEGAELPPRQAAEVEGNQYVVKHLALPGNLPWGYHRFILEIRGRVAEAMVIAAPLRAYQPPEGTASKGWGVFLPLYALHSRTSWGSGYFSDLERFTKWVADIGGSAVATLPLFATFPDKRWQYSPYVPISRLMWNELYIDITGVPELQKCPAAQEIIGSVSFRTELESLRNLPFVDYHRQMALKRRILKELSCCCFSETTERLESLHKFIAEHPVVEDYARFCATLEAWGTAWHVWPERLRGGTLQPADYDEEIKRYHLYVQWLASQQLEDLTRNTSASNTGLYLDLPLGVHPDGYDVWRNQSIFASEASGGAPPDPFFIRGQDWGFPPVHPERLREQHYEYHIACLRHSFRHARILRIDHVMSLHRLFWVPRGMKASEGVYVRYPAEELYAILSLESHRSKSVIVGEDLGTVPPEVRPAMSRHGLRRMYILQFEVTPDASNAICPVRPGMVAGLNTHDMPTFAAFWQGLDIEERLKLGFLDEVTAQRQWQYRHTLRQALSSFLLHQDPLDSLSQLKDILRAILGFLSRSPAYIVLVNLEDLWLETQSQNMPGTIEEHPNWQRKARYSFEEFSVMPEVTDMLHEIDRQRKQGSSDNA